MVGWGWMTGVGSKLSVGNFGRKIDVRRVGAGSDVESRGLAAARSVVDADGETTGEPAVRDSEETDEDE